MPTARRAGTGLTIRLRFPSLDRGVELMQKNAIKGFETSVYKLYEHIQHKAYPDYHFRWNRYR